MAVGMVVNVEKESLGRTDSPGPMMQLWYGVPRWRMRRRCLLTMRTGPRGQFEGREGNLDSIVVEEGVQKDVVSGEVKAFDMDRDSCGLDFQLGGALQCSPCILRLCVCVVPGWISLGTQRRRPGSRFDQLKSTVKPNWPAVNSVTHCPTGHWNL